jgi:hypothetical protein
MEQGSGNRQPGVQWVKTFVPVRGLTTRSWLPCCDIIDPIVSGIVHIFDCDIIKNFFPMVAWTVKLEGETKDGTQGSLEVGLGPERWLGNWWK